MNVLLMMSSVAMGGAERNIVSLLPYLQTPNVKTMLCTMNTRRDSPLANADSLSHIERFDLEAKRMLDIRAFKKLLSIIRKQEIDVIHAQDQDTIIYAGLASRLLGRPSVMTRHVLDESDINWRKRIRLRLVFLSARYGIHKVIAVSNAVRENFHKKTNIPYSRIEAIYNGIHLDEFLKTSRKESRLKLDWDLNRPICVFVSVLRPGKGFEVLFDGIPEIKKQIPDVQFKIIGGGKLEAELREQATPLGEAVEFLGQRMDIPDLIGASDLLVQTSWSEALPTVLIEAGASSVPVVASNVGGTSEIVQGGVGGILFQPGDKDAFVNAAVVMLRDLNKAREMGKAANQYVLNTFSLQKQAQATIELYEKVINEKKTKNIV